MQNWDKIQQDHNPHTIPHSRLSAFLDAADPPVMPSPMSQEMMLKIQSGDRNIGVYTIFNQHTGQAHTHEQEKKRRVHENQISSLSQVVENLATAQKIWSSLGQAFSSFASNFSKAAPLGAGLAVGMAPLQIAPFVYEEINIGSETARLLDQRLERIVQMSEKLETIEDPIERQQHEQALQRLRARTEERYGLRYAADGAPLAVDVSKITHLEERLNPEGLDISGTICAYVQEPEEPVCDVRPAPAPVPAQFHNKL